MAHLDNARSNAGHRWPAGLPAVRRASGAEPSYPALAGDVLLLDAATRTIRWVPAGTGTDRRGPAD